MEFINAFIIFLVGIIVGIAIVIARNKFFQNSSSTKEQLAQCQQEQALLKQEWQDQLANYKTLASQLEGITNTINNNIADAEHLMQKAESAPAFPFFSEEATEFLKTNPQQPRKKSETENQPLDYSATASGVFKGVAPEKDVEKAKP